MTHLPETSKEIVVAAALNFDGFIWTQPPPARHHTLLYGMVLFREKHGTRERCPPCEQGFITSTGRFVGREEAAIIAVDSGQIKSTNWGEELYSEDLW